MHRATLVGDRELTAVLSGIVCAGVHQHDPVENRRWVRRGQREDIAVDCPFEGQHAIFWIGAAAGIEIYRRPLVELVRTAGSRGRRAIGSDGQLRGVDAEGVAAIENAQPDGTRLAITPSQGHQLIPGEHRIRIAGIDELAIAIEVPLVSHDTVAARLVRFAALRAVERDGTPEVNVIRAAGIRQRVAITAGQVNWLDLDSLAWRHVVVGDTQCHVMQAEAVIRMLCDRASSIDVEDLAVIVEVPLPLDNYAIRAPVKRTGTVENHWCVAVQRIGNELRKRIVVENSQVRGVVLRSTKGVRDAQSDNVLRQPRARVVNHVQ